MSTGERDPGFVDLVALEAQARERLAPDVYDYIAGGAGDEVTLAANDAAWSDLRLRPRVLRDVTTVDLATTVLAQPLASPVGVAPTAFHGLAHPEGEVATSRGAAAAGALYVVSTRATATSAAIAAAAPSAPRWHQVYVLRDRDRTADLVVAARDAGCAALVLTADTPVLGRRLRDVRNRFVLPPAVGGSSMELGPGVEGNLTDQDPSVTFADIAWLRDLAGLPVVVKGVLRGDDARACIGAGAAGVWVSNHGGRQLDGAVPTATALVEVVDAVAGGGEVYVDGGIRSGTDVLKALALGARAAFLGRPVLWGLAAGGADGVAAVLRHLTRDFALAMALAGAASVSSISRDLIAPH